jgi:hypothetical protein
MGESAMDRNVRTEPLEPSLEEMLDDTVVQAVMRRDGVKRVEILGLVEWARLELGKRHRRAAIAAMRMSRAA